MSLALRAELTTSAGPKQLFNISGFHPLVLLSQYGAC